MTEEEHQFINRKEKKSKVNRTKKLAKEIAEADLQQKSDSFDDGGHERMECTRQGKHLTEIFETQEEQRIGIQDVSAEADKDHEANLKSIGKEIDDIKKSKRKKRLLKEAARAEKRGICYLSRIPPHMDPLKLRQILSQFGDIQRIYLTPENPTAQINRKRAGGFRGQEFSEGWVEFSDRRVAKRVANMLNGEQMGGKKRSSFYYDIWNIKYLSKFKWDDLTEEIAYKKAVRENKLALELSAAKRERDFYISKVDKSRALSSIEERLKKKQKFQESGANDQQAVKVVRQFPQTQPVSENAAEIKPGLSNDVLAGVFGGS